MIRGKKILSGLALAMVLACPAFAQRTVNTDTTHYQTLRIDPGNASGGDVSDVIESLNYIPLETTPESTFGSIAKLEVVDNYFIILDNATNCILIFKKDGKFHAKIKGNSADLPSRLRGFAVNRFTKQIVYSADRGKTYTYCDFDGKVINTVLHRDGKDNNFYLGKYAFIAADKIVNYSGYDEFDNDAKNVMPWAGTFIQYAQNAKIVYAKALPYKPAQGKSVYLSTNNLTRKANDTSYFVQSDVKHIYTVTPNTTTLSYKLTFPQYLTMPEGYLTDADYLADQQAYLLKHDGKIYCIESFYQNGNNLLFNAATWARGLEDNLLYNLKSGTLVAWRHINPDERSYYLPVFDNRGVGTTDKGFLANDGKDMYISLSSLEMFKTHEENNDKKIKYSPALTAYFEKGNRKDNPVLLQLKLKPNL